MTLVPFIYKVLHIQLRPYSSKLASAPASTFTLTHQHSPTFKKRIKGISDLQATHLPCPLRSPLAPPPLSLCSPLMPPPLSPTLQVSDIPAKEAVGERDDADVLLAARFLHHSGT